MRAVAPTAADSDWDTYSAVVTIHQGGAQFKSSVTDDASFHVTRVLQPDSSWRTTISAGRGSDGRTEIASDGMHNYDGAGREVVRRGPDLSSGAAAVRAQHPEQSPFPLPNPGAGGGPPQGRVGGRARDWADAFLAGPVAGVRARKRYAIMFGAPERLGKHHRYLRRRGGSTLEVLVDSLTGAPVDVKETRDGVLAVHVTHAYDRLANGSALLRETRVERPLPNGAGTAITVTRFDSVTFSRGGPVR